MSERKPADDKPMADAKSSSDKPAVRPTGQVDDNQDDMGRRVNARSDTTNPVNGKK